MKTKYRIVAKPCNIFRGEYWYVAQHKWLNLFWFDCSSDMSVPGYSINKELDMVELFVESLIAGNRYDYSIKVVKEYQ